MVRVLSYNIHSGIGNDGTYGLAKIAGVIRRSGADIACLQEVEFNSEPLQVRKWSKVHEDKQPMHLAKATNLGYWSYVGPLSAYMGEESREGEVLVRDRESRAVLGNAILSRYPILDKRTLLFEMEQEEDISDTHIYMDKEEQPRGACAVLVDIDPWGAKGLEDRQRREKTVGCCIIGQPTAAKTVTTDNKPGPSQPLWVINTHLSHRVGSEEQRSQARQLLDWIDGIYHAYEGLVRPGFVLCGDMNAPPLLPMTAYSTITGEGRWRDLWHEKGTVCFQATFPSGCCSSALGIRLDHIFAMQGDRAARLNCDEIHILGSPEDAEASDHIAVVADLSVEGRNSARC
mmetsp:Transcript_105737/g.210099  ORF Transcript_105737/g.210099 Transcript_105737/m.210099 type:complete len:345 (-) Transcript_105737:227-1261(-)